MEWEPSPGPNVSEKPDEIMLDASREWAGLSDQFLLRVTLRPRASQIASEHLGFELYFSDIYPYS